MRRYAIVFLLLFSTASSAGAELVPQTGNHTGEARALEYRIEYFDPLGVTTADASGITYAFSGGGTIHDVGTILPDRYFGDYPLYVSGGTLRFDVRVKNTSRRTFQNLRVLARQEFLNVAGGWGEPFPDTAMQEWSVAKLGPGEEVVLPGTLAIPLLSASGIDQTHLQIIHDAPSFAEATEGKGGGANGGPFDATHGGQIIVDDPQAGLWCPRA